VKRYLFLLKSLNTENKFLLLDMKQAMPSSVQPYVTVKQPHWKTEAERVIQVQQRMQDVSPALLGTTIFRGESYGLQQMQPTDDSINFEAIKDQYRDIYQVIDDMALLTASTELRSSGRQGSAIADKLIAFGKDDEWHESLLKYAEGYARTVRSDYKQYLVLYKQGKFGQGKGNG
jgi:uncharacterized protein (DUF2252 family)